MDIRRLIILITAIAILDLGRTAAATTITYNFWLDAPNGYSVTNLVYYAADASQDDVFLSPLELAPSGSFQLSHSLAFTPINALILGMTERDKDDWWDIVMFTSDAYAESSLGMRYDALFQDETLGYLGHSELTPTRP